MESRKYAFFLICATKKPAVFSAGFFLWAEKSVLAAKLAEVKARDIGQNICGLRL